MNFLSRKAVSRRCVLRGAGIGLALPLLDAMLPAATAFAATSTSRSRLPKSRQALIAAATFGLGRPREKATRSRDSAIG